jgi:hypothetical protein
MLKLQKHVPGAILSYKLHMNKNTYLLIDSLTCSLIHSATDFHSPTRYYLGLAVTCLPTRYFADLLTNLLVYSLFHTPTLCFTNPLTVSVTYYFPILHSIYLNHYAIRMRPTTLGATQQACTPRIE